MTPGAYSIVRYSNSLNDQRVNLGVLLWHPLNGFCFRFTPSLDRVKAIDPRTPVRPIKEQLEYIKGQLASGAGNGMDKLTALSQMFREGLEVTGPYPARLPSLLDSVDKLYEMLVSPVPEIRRASTQKKFRGQFSRILADVFLHVVPQGKYEKVGHRPVNGVEVDVGFLTAGKKEAALWRTLSLQSRNRRSDQLADAKAVALEIMTVRESLAEFKRARQFVVVQPPKPKHSEGLNDSIAWLKHGADEALLVDDIGTLPQVLSQALQTIK